MEEGEGEALGAGVPEEVMKRRKEKTGRIIKIVCFWQRRRAPFLPQTLLGAGDADSI